MKDFFYELKHEISADYFTVEEGRNFSFPMHMHRCYEIILLLEGSMQVKIERDAYRVEAGDVILIKPNRACYLLKNTRHSVTDIVSLCGFASVATFNHNFKELTSCSPTEYRQKNRA